MKKYFSFLLVFVFLTSCAMIKDKSINKLLVKDKFIELSILSISKYKIKLNIRNISDTTIYTDTSKYEIYQQIKNKFIESHCFIDYRSTSISYFINLLKLQPNDSLIIELKSRLKINKNKLVIDFRYLTNRINKTYSYQYYSASKKIIFNNCNICNASWYEK